MTDPLLHDPRAALVAESDRLRADIADGIVTATVNGVPGRLRIDPAVPALPLLTAAWAQRACAAYQAMPAASRASAVPAVAAMVKPASTKRRAASIAAPRLRPLSFACLISITSSRDSMS